MKKIKRKAIVCHTFSSFSDPDYPFDDPADIKAIQETLKIQPTRKFAHAGRTPSLTPLTQHIILKAIKLGLSIERSANLAGVSLPTLFRWKKCATDGDLDDDLSPEEIERKKLYKDFVENLKRAAIHGELEKLRLVNEAAKGGLPIREIKKVVKVNRKTGEETIVSKEVKTKSTLPSWQAAMTLLERRYPERWSRKVQIDEEDATEIANKIKSEVDRVLNSVPPKPSKSKK